MEHLEVGRKPALLLACLVVTRRAHTHRIDY